MPGSQYIKGVKYIRIKRYDLNGEDIVDFIAHARTITVNHGSGDVRTYTVKSSQIDPRFPNTYYIEVESPIKSQPNTILDTDVTISPVVEYDLDYHEYNALYSNATSSTKGADLFVVDRDTMIGVPRNLSNIIDKTEEEAEVQGYLDNIVSLRRSRYEGSKNTSTDINIFQAGDAAGFNKPAVEVTQKYYAYFTEIVDTYPYYPNKVAVKIQQLIGEDGSVLDPRLDDYAIHYIKENFEVGKNAIVELEDAKANDANMSALNGEHLIKFSGTKFAPIITSHFASIPGYLINNGEERYLDTTDSYLVFRSKDSGSIEIVSNTAASFNVDPDGSTIVRATNLLTSVTGTNIYEGDFEQIGIAFNPTNPPTGSLAFAFNQWITDFPNELEVGKDYQVNKTFGAVTGSTFIPIETTGYDLIVDEFNIQEGDLIIFHHQTLAYARLIYRVENVAYNGSTLILTFDRTISNNHITNHAFTVVRPQDDPTTVILDTNKALGKTSKGYLRPKYVSEEAREKIQEAIAKLG